MKKGKANSSALYKRQTSVLIKKKKKKSLQFTPCFPSQGANASMPRGRNPLQARGRDTPAVCAPALVPGTSLARGGVGVGDRVPRLARKHGWALKGAVGPGRLPQVGCLSASKGGQELTGKGR